MKFASVKRKRWRADDVLVNTIKKLLSHPPVAARSTMCTEQTVSKGSREGVGHRLLPSSCFSSSTEAVLAMPTAYGRLLTGSPAKCYLLELCNKCDREVYKTCTKCSKQQASVFTIHKYPSACPAIVPSAQCVPALGRTFFRLVCWNSRNWPNLNVENQHTALQWHPISNRAIGYSFSVYAKYINIYVYIIKKI